MPVTETPDAVLSGFFHKYHAVGCDGVGNPDYTTAHTDRLVSIVDQLGQAWTTASFACRPFIESDLVAVWSELAIRFWIAGRPDTPKHRAWVRASQVLQWCGLSTEPDDRLIAECDRRGKLAGK